MKVTDIARRSGLGAHTVRYYVRAGLIEPRRNPLNNYKQFGEEHVARLRFIKGAQALGFSLAEVRDLFGRMDRSECPCSAMQVRLADKMLAARAQLAALAQRLAFMQRVYEGWGTCGEGRHDLGSLCQFLEDQAARGSLPVDTNGALRASQPAGGAAHGTSPRSKQPVRRPIASAATEDRSHAVAAAPVFRLLQSEWNSSSTAQMGQ